MIALGELAKQIGAQLNGDAEFQVAGINTLSKASSSELAFIARPEFLEQASQSSAGVLMLAPAMAEQASFRGHTLLIDDPYLGYARASQVFDAFFNHRPGSVDPSASIASGVEIPADTTIGANVVVAEGAVVGQGCKIGPGCYLGAGSVLGDGTLLHANVTIYHGVSVGENCVIHSGTVVGSDGFGFAPSEAGWQKIHQLGGVRIGARVEIGANTAIDRGAIGDTVISDGVIIDNLVHIAHNVFIGVNTAIAGCCGFAGSTKVGANCTFAGQVGVTGHIEITDNCHFLGKAMVTNSVTEPGTYGSGVPMQPVKKWRRNMVRFSQLDDLSRLVNKLAKKIGEK
ncbi:UDP-3-O-(3-hydroxymyristoyl)glucosamine N-acyltransferase [Halioxenophilus aromaticivorans]|uniref:UDP-3-O-acylglucosamine N-acyltransferase n=1 Tax=Halioxenophilus aromaticivorans TaxID=1306992 RepID=A0AAV3TYR3_9ALTE